MKLLTSLGASLLALGMAAGFSPLASAQAQDYPSRPVRILVGYPPGAGSDFLARAFAAELQKSMGQAFVVENQAGANGVIAAQAVARAAPDGYTLGLVVPNNVTTILLGKGGGKNDYFKEFAPVGTIGGVNMILVANPAFPPRNVQELMVLAKAKPGEVTYAGAGNASTVHLFMELMNHTAGVKMQHVPYKGGTPGLQATLSGETNITWVSTQLGLPMIQAGKLKPLAVSTARRIKELPDVPTMVESGIPGFVIDIWYGLHAPYGTPPAIIQKLNAELNRISRTPQMQERLEKAGAIAMYSTPEQFSQIITAESTRWAELFKQVPISVD